MPVRRRLVGGKRLVAIGIVRGVRKPSARARHARLAVDDDRTRDEFCPEQRRGAERDRGRIAPRVADNRLPVVERAMQFGNAIQRLRVQIGAKIRLAVPLVVLLFAVQTEVSAEVDQLFAGGDALAGESLAQPVRQRRKHDVALRDDRVLVLEQYVAYPEEIGIYVAQLFAFEADRRRRDEPRLGMSAQQPREFRSGIAGRSHYSCFYHCSSIGFKTVFLICSICFFTACGAGPPTTFLPLTQVMRSIAS